jgi:hypothetical protein
LEAGSVRLREGLEEEAERHAVDGGEGDFGAAESGVEHVLRKGQEDDDGDGVKEGDNIVGHAMRFHCCSLRDEVSGHLALAEEEDGPGEAGENWILIIEA